MLSQQSRIHNHRLAVPINNLCFSNKKLQRISFFRTKTKPRQASICSVQLEEKTRRSADYHPTVWDHQFIQLIQSPYNNGDQFNERIEGLKHEVNKLLKETEGPLGKLELIDSIRRLGVGYHFEQEIGGALARSYLDGLDNLHGLNETALCFRLLREHGHNVSSATHLAQPGEQILEEAKKFSFKHLECLSKDIDLNLVVRVEHSLEAPLYWLLPRVEARHYIDVYERGNGMIPSLLELAKLDFNVVQALHQKEIQDLSRWWEELGLIGKASFSRDRIFENYFWGNGTGFEPQFGKCRKVVTKFISICNVIDDFYDTYGTLEEAEIFTAAIKRWDLKAMENLPYYLKLCYLAVYNFVNETTYDILKETGWDVSHLLKREWIFQCDAYLKEAEWYHKRITPSLEDYQENGWTSVGARVLIFHALYYSGHKLSEDSLDHMERTYRLVYLSSLLIRLIDDLTPSKAEMENGETSLSIQCYMKDSGESYETSKEFIKDLISSY